MGARNLSMSWLSMGWFVQLLNKFTTLTVNGFFSDKLDLAVFLSVFFFYLLHKWIFGWQLALNQQCHSTEEKLIKNWSQKRVNLRPRLFFIYRWTHPLCLHDSCLLPLPIEMVLQWSCLFMNCVVLINLLLTMLLKFAEYSCKIIICYWMVNRIVIYWKGWISRTAFWWVLLVAIVVYVFCLMLCSIVNV